LKFYPSTVYLTNAKDTTLEEDDPSMNPLRTTIELLREESLKKDAAIEKMRKEHHIQIQDYEEKIRELTHSKQMIEMKANTDLRKCVLYN
jgi:hypothetical protein